MFLWCKGIEFAGRSQQRGLVTSSVSRTSLLGVLPCGAGGEAIANFLGAHLSRSSPSVPHSR